MKITTSEAIKNINEHSASLFFTLLLCADFVFIVLHTMNHLPQFSHDDLYDLGNGSGYSEMFQYLQWLWIIILLAYLAILRRSFSYVAWVLVFAYFLCDDAFEIHENVGQYITSNITLMPPFGLRLQDIGELAVSATVGMILLICVTWAYLQGSQAFKKISQDLLLLILALIFFGVFVDMAHVAIQQGWKVDFILGTIEDGGEMLVASLILWYVFLLSVREENATAYLCDLVRGIMKN